MASMMSAGELPSIRSVQKQTGYSKVLISNAIREWLDKEFPGCDLKQAMLSRARAQGRQDALTEPQVEIDGLKKTLAEQAQQIQDAEFRAESYRLENLLELDRVRQQALLTQPDLAGATESARLREEIRKLTQRCELAEARDPLGAPIKRPVQIRVNHDEDDLFA